MEAQYRDLNNENAEGDQNLPARLADLYPDSLAYGLRLANLQDMGGDPKAAFDTLEGLRKLPPPSGDDPRIDLAEATAVEALGDYKREEEISAAAVRKARREGFVWWSHRRRLYESTALQQLGDADRAGAALAQAKVLFAGQRGSQALRDDAGVVR